MKIKLTRGAVQQYRKLPRQLRQKADKQFAHLVLDYRHPSLNTKKYKGADNLWQARIDKGWRFYFFIQHPDYIVVSIINHPK